MNRTVRFIIVIIAFVASLSGAYLYLKKQQSPSSSAIRAIPINSALILDVKDPINFFHQVDENNKLWQGLSDLKIKIDIESKVEMLDSLFSNPLFKESFKDKNLLISVHETSKNQFNPLFLVKLNGKMEANQIFKVLSEFYGHAGDITTFRYSQTKVYKFTPNTKNAKILFFSFSRGILLASNNELLLQDAIRQTGIDEGLTMHEGFMRLKETSGQNVDANLYIQFKFFKELLQQRLNRQYLKSLGIKNFADWCSLDLNLKNQVLLMNGFATSLNKSEEFSHLFKGQKPINLKFVKYVPAEAEGFTAFGISDLRKYRQSLLHYMEANGDAERHSINQNHINQSFGKDAGSNLEAIFNNELIHISQSDDNSIFLIKTTGSRDATEFIEKSLKHYASRQQVSFNYLEKEYIFDKDLKFKVYKMPVDYLPTRLFGPWFKSAKAEYVAVFNDYLVFGNTYKSLTRFIYSNILEKTLSYDKDFQLYENYLSSKVNFYLYLGLTGNGAIAEKLLNKKGLEFFNNNQEKIRDFYGLSWQFTQEENYLYNNLLLKLQPSNKLKAATEWESRLDTLVGIKPVLVRNHYSKEKEIFVQDLKNKIYLINKSGRIVWKKQLEEKIMGEVVQVDFYKNGKLQLLFNTKNKIHVLDRNGTYVERYPVKLPSPAVAPLSVFDYDNRKNYRIFIPMQNQKVNAYGIDGKVISGFKFPKTDNPIIGSVQYFRISSKDYIIVTDESRTYILDRKGNKRLDLKKQFTPSKRNQYILQSGNNLRKSRLVRTGTDGTIYYIYMDGSIEEQALEPMSENHYFNLEDITGDRVGDFIFVDNEKLEAFNISGKKLFNYKFSSPIVKAPAFYKFSATKTYIGICDASNRKIYLIDSKGKAMDNFPLPGKTRFSIGVLTPGSGRFNLLVGGDNQYLYNYKLN